MRYRRNPDAEKAKMVAYIEAAVHRLKTGLHPIALYQLSDKYLSSIAVNLHRAAVTAGLEIQPYGTEGMDDFMMDMAQKRPWFRELDDTTVSHPKSFTIPSTLSVGGGIRKNPRRKKRIQKQ